MMLMTSMKIMMDSMVAIPSSGGPDRDFAALMRAHHLGAIEMAHMELQNGTDDQMKQLAGKAISEQKQEIDELNKFLAGAPAGSGGNAYHKEAMDIMNNMPMSMDHSCSFDHQFAQMMIPHHQSGVDMSKAYLKYGKSEELRKMANDIIASQGKEIGEMRAWMEKNK
jgi:uncharacterized protein (DUF305 family)